MHAFLFNANWDRRKAISARLLHYTFKLAFLRGAVPWLKRNLAYQILAELQPI
jgi:hypothetical protein